MPVTSGASMSIAYCPDRLQWKLFLAGRLPREAHEELERHIENCAACQTSLQSIEDPRDSFIDGVHEAALADVLRLETAVQPPEGSPQPIDVRSPTVRETASREVAAGLPSMLGEFRLLREIGRGGMGVVYEAEQFSLGRRVAVKILPFTAMLDPKRIQRFENEARAVATLDNPHIVPVHSVGVEGDVHFYSMKLIDGRNLAEFIRAERERLENAAPSSGASTRASLGKVQKSVIPSGTTVAIRAAGSAVRQLGNGSPSGPVALQFGETSRDETCRRAADSTEIAGRLDPSHYHRIAEFGRQAAGALQHAHENGVIHRDVKPSNLMLDRSGKVWVTDFGLAQFEAELGATVTGQVLGTRRYMSPEQASGRRGAVDHRTDVYSLGVTLYELLTLASFFGEADGGDLMQKILTEDPIRPRRLNPRIPADLETIVLKAMAKDQQDRYATAGELDDDLNRFLEGKPILARPPGVAERLSKWIRRHQTLATTLIASTAILLLVSVTAATALWRQGTQLATAVVSATASQSLAEERALEARSTAYAATMGLAFDAYKNHDPVKVARLLDRFVPTDNQSDLRGFEWYFLDRLVRRAAAATQLSDKRLHVVRQSPDGKVIAAAGAAATISIVDPGNLTVLLQIDTRQVEVNGLAFSPDSSRLASAGDDGNIKVWDVATGNKLFGFQAHNPRVFSVEYIAEGKQLISTGYDRTIRIWDSSNGDRVDELSGHKERVTAAAHSDAGNLFASACRKDDIRVWDLATRKLVRTIPVGSSNRITSLSFSPDGTVLASGDQFSNVMLTRLDGSPPQQFAHFGDPIHCLTFTADGTRLVIADRSGAIHSFVLGSIDKDRKPSPMNEPLSGPLELFDMQTDWHAHKGRCYDLIETTGGQIISVGEDGLLKTWDPTNGAIEKVIFGSGRSVSNDHKDFAVRESDGLMAVAAADRGLELFHRSGDRYKRLRNIEGPGWWSVAFDRSTGQLVSGHNDGKLRFWDISKTEPVAAHTIEPGNNVSHVSISSTSEHWILTLEGPNQLRIFDKSGKQLAAEGGDFHPGVQTVSHDGALLCYSLENDVIIWDLANGKRRLTLRGHTDTVKAAAFIRDDSRLVTGSTDRSVSVWDLNTGDRLSTFVAHSSGVTALEFSPDGRTLAVGGHEGPVQLWHLGSELPMGSLPSNGAEFLYFSDGGQNLIVGSRAEQFLIFHADRTW